MEDEMGGQCSTHGGDKKSIKHYCRKSWREEITWKIQT